MSPFVKFRNEFEAFMSSTAHQVADFFHPLLTQAESDLKTALPILGEVAFQAAVGALGGGTEAAYQAAKVAVLAKGAELGIQDANSLAVSLRALALNGVAKAQAAPPVV